MNLQAFKLQNYLGVVLFCVERIALLLNMLLHIYENFVFNKELLFPYLTLYGPAS